MESLMFPLFILNTVLIIGDACLGYLLTPSLLQGLCEPETAQQGVRPTRSLLSAVVALYMFFNCLGYFQAKSSWLLTVLVLVIADMLLQIWLVRRNAATAHPEDEE